MLPPTKLKEELASNIYKNMSLVLLVLQKYRAEPRFGYNAFSSILHRLEKDLIPSFPSTGSESKKKKKRELKIPKLLPLILYPARILVPFCLCADRAKDTLVKYYRVNILSSSTFSRSQPVGLALKMCKTDFPKKLYQGFLHRSWVSNRHTFIHEFKMFKISI